MSARRPPRSTTRASNVSPALRPLAPSRAPPLTLSLSAGGQADEEEGDDNLDSDQEQPG